MSNKELGVIDESDETQLNSNDSLQNCDHEHEDEDNYKISEINNAYKTSMAKTAKKDNKKALLVISKKHIQCSNKRITLSNDMIDNFKRCQSRDAKYRSTFYSTNSKLMVTKNKNSSFEHETGETSKDTSRNEKLKLNRSNCSAQIGRQQSYAKPSRSITLKHAPSVMKIEDEFANGKVENVTSLREPSFKISVKPRKSSCDRVSSTIENTSEKVATGVNDLMMRSSNGFRGTKFNFKISKDSCRWLYKIHQAQRIKKSCDVRASSSNAASAYFGRRPNRQLIKMQDSNDFAFETGKKTQLSESLLVKMNGSNCGSSLSHNPKYSIGNVAMFDDANQGSPNLASSQELDDNGYSNASSRPLKATSSKMYSTSDGFFCKNVNSKPKIRNKKNKLVFKQESKVYRKSLSNFFKNGDEPNMNKTKYGRFMNNKELQECLSEEEDTTAEGEDNDYKDYSHFNMQANKPNQYSIRTDSTGFPSNRRLKVNLSKERENEYKNDRRALLL